MHGQGTIVVANGPIEIDNAVHEFRLKYPDTAKIQQIYGVVLAYGIIAEVGVAVNDAVLIERQIPGAEQVARNVVPRFEGCVLEFEQPRAVEPGHGQSPPDP